MDSNLRSIERELIDPENYYSGLKYSSYIDRIYDGSPPIWHISNLCKLPQYLGKLRKENRSLSISRHLLPNSNYVNPTTVYKSTINTGGGTWSFRTLARNYDRSFTVIRKWIDSVRHIYSKTLTTIPLSSWPWKASESKPQDWRKEPMEKLIGQRIVCREATGWRYIGTLKGREGYRWLLTQAYEMIETREDPEGQHDWVYLGDVWLLDNAVTVAHKSHLDESRIREPMGRKPE